MIQCEDNTLNWHLLIIVKCPLKLNCMRVRQKHSGYHKRHHSILFRPAWVVTWGLRFHLVPLSRGFLVLSVTGIRVCSFTLAYLWPRLMTENGFSFSVFTMNNCQQNYPVLFGPVEFGKNQVKARGKILFPFQFLKI